MSDGTKVRSTGRSVSRCWSRKSLAHRRAVAVSIRYMHPHSLVTCATPRETLLTVGERQQRDIFPSSRVRPASSEPSQQEFLSPYCTADKYVSQEEYAPIYLQH